MAKLRALSKDEDLGKIPTDQPVLVELLPTPTAIVGDDAGDEPAKGGDETRVEARQPTQEDGDDGFKALREQLKASEDARKADQDRIAQLDKDRREARQLADDRKREADQLRTQQTDSEHELIISELASAESESNAARSEYKRAAEAGDFDAMADAQVKLADARAKMINFKGAQAQYEIEKTQRANAPKEPERKSEPIDVLASIDGNSNYLPAEKVWLKAHPELIMDAQRNAELGVAYNKALKAGHSRGTDGYFKFMNEFLDYEAPAKRNGDDDDRVIPSAPVSRNNMDQSTGRSTSSRVYLNADQRQMAASMGISDREYAEGYVKLEADKRAQPEKYNGR